MWPFRVGWSKKQKNFRRLCRQEEQELEHLINWQELNMQAIRRASKTAQDQSSGPKATPAPAEALEDKEAPFSCVVEALPDEWSGNADPKGDACCVQR